MDWDDARIFLAVARHRSLRAAGRALGLSQPTVGRRLAAFEAAFGGPPLFDRLPEGLRLNAAGEALVPAAERLETAALALERRRAAASPTLSGTVRVSVGEWAAILLARHLADARQSGLPPGITLELVESPQTANLARRDADLALRHGVPEAGNLYVTKVGVIAGALYRRHDESSLHHRPRDLWVTYTEEHAHYSSARWLDQQIRASGGRVVLRASDLLMRIEAVRAGVGNWAVAVLCRRRRPMARTGKRSGAGTCCRLLGDRAPRSAAGGMRACGDRMDPTTFRSTPERARRVAGDLAGLGRSRTRFARCCRMRLSLRRRTHCLGGAGPREAEAEFLFAEFESRFVFRTGCCRVPLDGTAACCYYTHA